MTKKMLMLSAAIGVLGAVAAGAQTTTTPSQQTPPPAASPPATTTPPAATPPAATPPATTPPAATTTPPATTTATAPKSEFIAQQMAGQLLATEITGRNVYGPNNERIGDVNDLLIDKDGKVVALVVGVGGFLGIGEKAVAIPYSAVKSMSGADGDRMTVTNTKADLEAAPRFVTTKTATSPTTGPGTTTTAPRATTPDTTKK
jgi:sporulation protein YlmC with PRC-barrel domain